MDAEDIAQPIPGWRVEVHPASAPSILREPSKYIFQCSGELSEIGVFISVHSTMKSTNACDLMVVRLQNSCEYGLSESPMFGVGN
jgi:hypothetical protein